ncbi:aminotransferase class I/II-fold pyridoxal phosphate-dependent enzyme [Kineothrix sp. MB12-C1]|uniref:aminotransferase class I/II-fold pyridoxal phosphate-dependent enzyme n=1 Tax=Kineothrix sp. MB12-C1 TaxID=3070215 RepID=UPI0027D299CB|nr:aminotransferase class I/II-fold pyridoxal phosphate-dependent enzyme [Kineothrix sp. MB12-C1]WMC94331.1 aminotransferase class I/II-fold pyridoxal phosphate-dependent enzyme [Kineothrix sp. MB12-C1]
MSNLYKELEQYRDSDYYPFHMPGHKGREDFYGGNALKAAYGIDITEIDGFDNLHQPEGIIKEAQQEAAKLYGSEETFFLVNGSTCGVLSAIMAATKRGGRLLMARNCHKSVYYAVYLQELEVSYLYPGMIEGYGIADAISAASVERMLKEIPDIEAVILTSPTYEGIASNISEIANIVHEYGKPLIVDEAHGAHFGFHKELPENAVRQGADLVIHSVHKSLPSMTQTALLHVSGERINRERLRRYLKIFQTSSPSYVLMASIDLAMNLMREEGHARLEHLIRLRRNLIKEMAPCKHLEIPSSFLAPDGQIRTIEAGKIVIGIKDGALTGQQLYDILREEYHLQMEMAAECYVLAVTSLMDSEEGLKRLARSLFEIDQRISDFEENKKPKYEFNKDRKRGCPEAVMNIAKAIAISEEKGYDVIPLCEAKGQIACEFLNLYPPGIPIVVPGEKIDDGIIEAVQSGLDMKLNMLGVEDGKIKVLQYDST